ncbi:MAG: hypothetical protein R3F34_04500 [Planctomycetota bacterium]
MARRTSRVRAKPLKVTSDPTNVCQLRCPLCPTGLELRERPAKVADVAVFERLIEEIGDEVFFLDFFNWGEPLLHKHHGVPAARGAQAHLDDDQFEPEPRASPTPACARSSSPASTSSSSPRRSVVGTAGTHRRRGD